jgi:hypothetical protein
MTPYLEKPITQKVLVEWLKVKALSSNPNTAKKKKNEGLAQWSTYVVSPEFKPQYHQKKKENEAQRG